VDVANVSANAEVVRVLKFFHISIPAVESFGPELVEEVDSPTGMLLVQMICTSVLVGEAPLVAKKAV
jgi:hypothetical protein